MTDRTSKNNLLSFEFFSPSEYAFFALGLDSYLQIFLEKFRSVLDIQIMLISGVNLSLWGRSAKGQIGNIRRH